MSYFGGLWVTEVVPIVRNLALGWRGAGTIGAGDRSSRSTTSLYLKSVVKSKSLPVSADYLNGEGWSLPGSARPQDCKTS